MFNYIFISYYKMFLRSKDDMPTYGAACFVSLVIIGWLFFLTISISKLFDYKITFTTSSKELYVILHILLMILLYRFFRKKEQLGLLDSFENKSIFFQRIWYFVSLTILIVPYILIAILLTK